MFDPIRDLPMLGKIWDAVQSFQSWILNVVLLVLYILFLGIQGAIWYFTDDADRDQIKRRIRSGTFILIALFLLISFINWLI